MANENAVAVAPTTAPPANTCPCPDCGHTISKRALSCPGCGCPFIVSDAIVRPTRVLDLDISFGHLVWLMVKSTIAAIPAAIIILVLGACVTTVFGGLIRGLATGLKP